MTILAALTIFDYGVIAVLVISALFSTLRGMTREFLGLMGWFIAIALSRVIAPYLEPKIEAFVPIEAIIKSMTPHERENPNILNGSRKNRIAKGSGQGIQEVNKLIKQFEQTRKMMKMMGDKRNMMNMMRQMQKGGMR